MQLNAAFKAYPPHFAPIDLKDAGAQGWQVLQGDLSFPLALLKASALQHNLDWMQDFCKTRGLDIAPHGKTTMSPELFAQQLAAGAWGLTFATAFQARVGVAAGARRVVIANQVVCDADLDAFDVLLAEHADLRVWFLVDSLAQLALIEDWARRRAIPRVFDVLLEMGIPGQRTGCRTRDEALALARALAASTSGSSSSNSNSCSGDGGGATISSWLGNSGSRRMPALAGSPSASSAAAVAERLSAATTRPDQSSADGLGASGAATRSGGVRMRS